MSATEKEKFQKGLELIVSIASRIFVYPFCGRPKRILCCYFFVNFLIIFLTAQQFVYLCVTGLKSFLDIVVVAPNIGVCVMGATKYIKVHVNKRIYRSIFDHIRFELWEIVSDNAECKKIVKKYQRIIILLTFLLISYVIPLIIIIASFPLLIMYYEIKVLGKELEYRYPIAAWYPFDKVEWYYVAYLWECFATGLVVLIYTLSELINFSYVGYICLELRLIGTHLKDFIEEEDIRRLKKSENVAAIHDKIKRKLRMIIIKHNFVVDISSDLERVLGDIMLVNYTLGSVFICLTGFTFVVADELYTTLRCFFFFISLILSMFNQCIMGQLLSDHSKQLAEALCFSNWTYGDRQTRQLILLLTMRMQKPLELTAKGYVVMNLDTFTAICSSSYQFFNLLRTMYNP